MDAWARLNEIAAAQYGHLTLAQARACGIAERTLQGVAMRHAWTQVHRGVYRLPGSWPTDHGRIAAAVLAVGPPVLVARWSAAWLYGLVRAAPAPVELLVPHDRRPRFDAGALVSRSRRFPATRALVHGLPATEPARTLCDLAALTDVEGLRALLIDARQRRLVDLPEVAEHAGGMGNVKGMGRLRALLYELDGERCDSVLEQRLRTRLREAGFPAPAATPFPVDVGDRILHVDIGWPERRVGVEADGFGAHSDRRSLEIDARRHNALQLAGWRILRATWAELGDGFSQFARDLAALLGAPGTVHAAYGVPSPQFNGDGRVTPQR